MPRVLLVQLLASEPESEWLSALVRYPTARPIAIR